MKTASITYQLNGGAKLTLLRMEGVGQDKDEAKTAFWLGNADITDAVQAITMAGYEPDWEKFWDNPSKHLGSHYPLQITLSARCGRVEQSD